MQQKFLTDFKEALEKIGSQQQIFGNLLVFTQAESLMRELGYANDQSSNKKEIGELWKIMKGEE